MSDKGQKRNATATDTCEVVFILCVKCGREFIPRVSPKDVKIKICDECAAKIAVMCMTDAAAAKAVKYYGNK